jgi:hypothetical protein
MNMTLNVPERLDIGRRGPSSFYLSEYPERTTRSSRFVIGTVPRWDAISPRLQRKYPNAMIALKTLKDAIPIANRG